MSWNNAGRKTEAHALLAVFVGTLVLFTLAAPARAGDDSGCHNTGVGDIPADGDVDVVRNPMIVLQDRLNCTAQFCGLYDITLRDASDNETLAFQRFLVDDGCVPVHFPETLLDPETTYCIDGEWICFTTGVIVDQEAPAFELGSDDKGSGLYVEWTGSQDIVMITMYVGSSLGTQGIAMPAVRPLDESSWAEDDGDTILLTAWDHAGNSTTQPVRLRIPGGCQTGTGLRSPLIFALVLLFLVGAGASATFSR